MYKVFQLLSIIILYLLFYPLYLSGQTNAESFEWELLKNDDGILIYKKKHNSGFNTIKIETDLSSTPKQINRFLLNIDYFPKWIYRCDSAKVLSVEDNKNYYLISIQFPFPFDNRYAVIESIHHLSDKELIITSKNVMPDYSVSKMVKIPFFSACWTAKSTSEGNVRISFEMTSDPGGNIPAWLYNFFFIEAPFQTMLRLKEELLCTTKD